MSRSNYCFDGGIPQVDYHYLGNEYGEDRLDDDEVRHKIMLDTTKDEYDTKHRISMTAFAYHQAYEVMLVQAGEAFKQGYDDVAFFLRAEAKVLLEKANEMWKTNS